MPQVTSSYAPPFLFKNGHFSTLYSGLLRRVSAVVQSRERFVLKDGDFIDMDWSYSKTKSENLIVAVHGLEGNAQRPYMLGITQTFTENGFDVACLNLRGCSGIPNRFYRSYHSGATEDLREIIASLVYAGRYRQLFLIGFSLGGNLILKYLGESFHIPPEIRGGVAISVPCDLYGSMLELHKPKNALYAFNFKKHLLAKLREKQQLFPEQISERHIKKIATLKDFDDAYTAPAHGFENALDYYAQSSSLQFLSQIRVPVLIINAKNDSFLSSSCFPIKEAQNNPNVFLEIPKWGGHVGFYAPGTYYNEEKSLLFIQEHSQ